VRRVPITVADKTILVPLTTSLYVPGKLANTDSVMVDVGTGYYVEKASALGSSLALSYAGQTRAQATAFYTSKVEFIRSNLESLQATLTRKQEQMSSLVVIMQTKLKE
jgi:prefoldin alpha subunit